MPHGPQPDWRDQPASRHNPGSARIPATMQAVRRRRRPGKSARRPQNPRQQQSPSRRQVEITTISRCTEPRQPHVHRLRASRRTNTSRKAAGDRDDRQDAVTARPGEGPDPYSTARPVGQHRYHGRREHCRHTDHQQRRLDGRTGLAVSPAATSLGRWRWPRPAAPGPSSRSWPPRHICQTPRQAQGSAGRTGRRW